MSRIGKEPVRAPKGVEVEASGGRLRVKGALGELSCDLSPLVEVKGEEGEGGGKVFRVSTKSETRAARAMWGTTRALLANMVRGATEGFEVGLEVHGVGYRMQAQGGKVRLSLGFSHDVLYELPEGVTALSPSATTLRLKGVDKRAVGQAAAEIRRYRPPEPYKGKGVRLEGEYVYRKEGKKK